MFLVMNSMGTAHYNSAHAQARAFAARRIRLEPRKPLYRLDRCRSIAAGRRGSARRGPAPESRRLRLRFRLDLGAQARHPHAESRAGGTRPAVDPGGEGLAPERAPL